MQQAIALKTVIFVTLLLPGALVLNHLYDGQNETDATSAPLYRQELLRPQVTPPAGGGYSSCANPEPNAIRRCQEIERQILATTVRIEVEAWLKHPVGAEEFGLYEHRRKQSLGHGTIKDGRYLVTHNHFDMPLPTPGHPTAWDYGSVRLFTASGDKLAVLDLNTAFVIVEERPETLVLDFGTVAGEGFFAAMDLPSARFAGRKEIALQSGMTVAQVDWEGSRAQVKWIAIAAVVTGQVTPHLVFAASLTQGASGGGVFYDGYHVANNWRVIEQYDRSGRLLGQRSMAALN